MKADGYSYIGKLPCGCVIAAVVDRPDYQSEVLSAIKTWLLAGLAVERVESAWVRENGVSDLDHSSGCPLAQPELFDTED